MAEPGELPQGALVDPRRQDRARQRQSTTKSTRERVLRDLMSTLDGRKFIWNELSSLYIFRQTFVAGPEGYAATAFNEGKRAYGLMMLEDIVRLTPALYTQMAVENSAAAEQQDKTDD